MREQKKKAEGAKKIRGIAHENDKSKGISYVQVAMENSCTTMRGNCSACGKDPLGRQRRVA